MVSIGFYRLLVLSRAVAISLARCSNAYCVRPARAALPRSLGIMPHQGEHLTRLNKSCAHAHHAQNAVAARCRLETRPFNRNARKDSQAVRRFSSRTEPALASESKTLARQAAAAAGQRLTSQPPAQQNSRARHICSINPVANTASTTTPTERSHRQS